MPAARLKRRFGQHHLRHPALCRPLLDYLRPRGRRVLEIGAGGGLLTGELLGAGARVWAWEIDPDWAFALRRWQPRRALAVVAGDALGIDWGRLPAATLVTGNLPYGVATRIIQQLLECGPAVERGGFLVQLEVARRLAAGAGDPDYGSLSVLVQAHAEVELLGRVRRGSFRPPPRVEGAFVGLRRRPPPVPASEWHAYAALVRLAFARRRKSLRNALAARWDRRTAEELVAALGLPAVARAVELEPERFFRLYRECRRRGLLPVA